MRRSRIPVNAMLLAVTTAFAAACVSDRPTPLEQGGVILGNCRVPVGSGVVGSVGAIVAIREFRFFPDTIRVPAGTTITWINCEEDFADEPHTSTSLAGDNWRSELLSPGDLYQRRFDRPGTYNYFCEPHSFMTATVIVE
jgi:plastocyanin